MGFNTLERDLTKMNVKSIKSPTQINNTFQHNSSLWVNANFLVYMKNDKHVETKWTSMALAAQNHIQNTKPQKSNATHKCNFNITKLNWLLMIKKKLLTYYLGIWAQTHKHNNMQTIDVHQNKWKKLHNKFMCVRIQHIKKIKKLV